MKIDLFGSYHNSGFLKINAQFALCRHLTRLLQLIRILPLVPVYICAYNIPICVTNGIPTKPSRTLRSMVSGLRMLLGSLKMNSHSRSRLDKQARIGSSLSAGIFSVESWLSFMHFAG